MTALTQIKHMADLHQATTAQIILAWYLQNAQITTVIPGARVPEASAGQCQSTRRAFVCGGVRPNLHAVFELLTRHHDVDNS
jgi:hypothetical protein